MATIDESGRVRLESLSDLAELRDCARAVICPTIRGFSHYLPAAWVINLQGTLILRLMNAGLYVYEKKGSPRP